MIRQNMVLGEIIVLQANSHKCRPPKEGGMPGARPGLLYNTATADLFDQVGFLPVARYREIDQTAGTFGLFGLVVPDWNDAQHAARVHLPFTRGQITGYQYFMTQALSLVYPKPGRTELVRPPIWAHRYRLTTRYVSKGRWQWYSPALGLCERPPIKSLIKPSDPLYRAAKEFRETILGSKMELIDLLGGPRRENLRKALA
jgi:hypothetical protein